MKVNYPVKKNDKERSGNAENKACLASEVRAATEDVSSGVKTPRSQETSLAGVLPPVPSATPRDDGKVVEQATETSDWRKGAQRLIVKAKQLGDLAMRLADSAEVVVGETKRDTSAATTHTTNCLKECLKESFGLKKELDKELCETGYTISQLEAGLEDMERQCALAKVPLGQLEVSNEMRGANRAAGERIRDTVVVKKQEHLNVVSQELARVRERYFQKSELLRQMVVLQTEMQEDLLRRQKEVKCLDLVSKVTPIKTTDLHGGNAKGTKQTMSYGDPIKKIHHRKRLQGP
jgi:nitrate reductase NapAB chaperone NapD